MAARHVVHCLSRQALTPYWSTRSSSMVKSSLRYAAGCKYGAVGVSKRWGVGGGRSSKASCMLLLLVSNLACRHHGWANPGAHQLQSCRTGCCCMLCLLISMHGPDSSIKRCSGTVLPPISKPALLLAPCLQGTRNRGNYRCPCVSSASSNDTRRSSHGTDNAAPCRRCNHTCPGCPPAHP